MPHHRHRLSAIAAAALLAGCSAEAEAPDAALTAAAAQPPPPASVAAIAPAPGGYKLTALEERLDCQKLTGQMRVRIANMRAAFATRQPSEAARVAQGAVTPILGGTRNGADPASDLAADRAKLEAFNQRLTEKKCKPLDLDAELRGETPPAKAPPPKKA